MHNELGPGEKCNLEGQCITCMTQKLKSISFEKISNGVVLEGLVIRWHK